MNKDLKVEYVSTSVLIVADYNPRKHTVEQKQQLKDSIKKFGLIDPIICNSFLDRKNIVIGGHFRLKVAKELGYETVPVVYVHISDIQKEKELNLRLNKNIGEWSYDLLKEFDYSFLENIGFTDTDLSFWDESFKVNKDNFDVKEELKLIQTPSTKLGDIIVLGRHKLICGDSTDPDVLNRLCGEDKISMIYSDPVYNININYNGGIGGKQNYGGTVQDNRTDEEYEKFIEKNMQSSLLHLKKDAHVFYWCDESYIWLFQTLYRKHGITNRRVCLWVKNGHNPTPTVAFNKSYEPCVYGTIGNPPIQKKRTGYNEILNQQTTSGNILFDEIESIWLEKRLSSTNYKHATSKPPELHEKAILRCTKPNDIILDSFSGSGSTFLAAESLGRIVYGVELEPIFCDLIISRFEKNTNTKAKVIRNEKTSS